MRRSNCSLVVLGLALVVGQSAPRVVAEEGFDEAAVACAEDAYDQPPQSGLGVQHFLSASEWGECLVGAVAAAEFDLNVQFALAADRAERKALRKRAVLLRKLGAAAALTVASRGMLTDPDPGAWDDSANARGVRSMLVLTTDLRFLALESFRTVWNQILRGAEARRNELAGRIDDALAELAAESGAEQTKQGQKALKLAALAVVLIAEMQSVRDAMEIPLAAVPDFGVEEDRAARRTRKQFKGLGQEFGSLLMTLARVVRKVEDKVATAVESARDGGPCDLTNPQDPFIGGGVVRASIDDGSEETWAGQTNAGQVGTKRAIVWFGSFQQDRPAILFELYGLKTTKPGTYDVLARPAGDDAFTRDYAVGALKLDEGAFGTNVYWLVGGELKIDTFQTGRKRRIAGSFDVWGEDPDDSRLRHIVGTFDLCGFRIERGDGSID